MQIRAAKFTAEKKLMYLYQELRPMAMGMAARRCLWEMPSRLPVSRSYRPYSQ